MKLNQLRYICEVARRGLNVSAAAEALYTSQPGVSKQIRLLEEELGVQIFARSGKHLSHITPAGKEIIAEAEQILAQVRNIRSIAEDYDDDSRGSLSIATTHTQARHALPEVVRQFRERYPLVSLHIHQGTPMQIAELAARGKVDFAIATEAIELFEDLVMMPCYRWNRCVVVPKGHPLLSNPPLTLEKVASYPLITYVFGFTGRSKLDQAFEKVGLTPEVVLTATDSEVIKTYVSLGLGIGILASMAYNRERDTELEALDASHLFESSITNIGFRRGTHLRRYMYDFIQLFAPHLTPDIVERASQLRSKEERVKLFAELDPDIGTK
ncbi:transcriptional regulator CysB [Alkalilimnicola ehrlichii]|uniref:Transcriptional regulator CysB n=1 Tax=Alkalilimnicola ehrlichii TaxID=351052 RepID=A0A3E0X1G4_9GAMM|nr:HTH-type transcriptional regulator CysB [Alkalilimnicola ehrlichii]RFA28369.1 transcriptional regulator CysB [Alkalilimnicola ehrlichii]RFA38566.1 transcriptional regulator CysB [Alkalilimnicola ehrlichii]